jgi:hypothetical protein
MVLQQNTQEKGSCGVLSRAKVSWSWTYLQHLYLEAGAPSFGAEQT